MLSRFRLAGLFLFGIALSLGTACGSADTELNRQGGPLPDTSDGGAVGSDGGTAIPFCEALGVVRDKCQRCHGDPLQNSAPVPFLSYEDFFAPYGSTDSTYGEIAVRAVDGNVMPFVALNDGSNPVMPPVEPLTPSEKATLLGWLKQGLQPEAGTDCP